MSIKHSTTAVTGSRGLAADWNAAHVCDDEDKPKAPVTLIVAADNSLDTSRADYVCDGTDDQVQIQEAIDALVASVGGRVVLLEGTFSVTAVVTIPGDNITLEGQGPSTRVLVDTLTGYSMISDGNDNVRIRDMLFEKVGADARYGPQIKNGLYCELDGIVSKEITTYLLELNLCSRCSVLRCGSVDGHNPNMELINTSESLVALCVKGEVWINLDGDSNNNTILGNHADRIRISAATCDDNLVVGNQVEIYINSGTGTIAFGNVGA